MTSHFMHIQKAFHVTLHESVGLPTSSNLDGRPVSQADTVIQKGKKYNRIIKSIADLVTRH